MKSDGFAEVRIAVLMLWASVLAGLGSIAARYVVMQDEGVPAAAALSPLLITGVLFIFVQARLIMRLSRGDGKVRTRILVLSVLRVAVYIPAMQQMLAVSTLLLVFPVISAILQFGALFLLFTPPGSHWFAGRAQR